MWTSTSFTTESQQRAFLYRDKWQFPLVEPTPRGLGDSPASSPSSLDKATSALRVVSNLVSLGKLSRRVAIAT